MHIEIQFASTIHYIYIYIYIYMCVCVCVCERERERERESVYVYCHQQTDCFIVSQLFSVARHEGRFKLGLKPAQLYVTLRIIQLSPQSRYVSSGIIRHWPFTLEELDSVLRKIKNRKAAGLDEIPPELWKTRQFDDILLRHCNAVYVNTHKTEYMC